MTAVAVGPTDDAAVGDDYSSTPVPPHQQPRCPPPPTSPEIEIDVGILDGRDCDSAAIATTTLSVAKVVAVVVAAAVDVACRSYCRCNCCCYNYRCCCSIDCHRCGFRCR